jgi:di/tricarboxylate transporter
LFVDGAIDELKRLLQLQSLEVKRTEIDKVPMPLHGVAGVRFRVSPESSLIGHSLRDLEFRKRFGLVVIGLRRADLLRRTHLAEEVLHEGDELLALGTEECLDAFTDQAEFDVRETGLRAIRELSDQLFAIRIPEDSPLVGSSIAGSRLSELAGLTVAGLVRGEETSLAITPEQTLEAGDRLLITAEPSIILSLEQLGEVQLEQDAAASPLESEEIGMVEAAVAPRSVAAGRTLAELDFRGRYGLLALALWRQGQAVHEDFSNAKLEVGDALLLHGPRERIKRMAREPDFVVLSEADQAPRRIKKAKYAFFCLILMVALVAGGLQPIHVAAFTAASLAILAGALTMQEAYRAIEWKAIFLVAAVLPVGVAMERTGAAQFLADSVITVAGPIGSVATLAALAVMASLLSQGLDGAPAVVLMAPVVIQAAEGLGISPYPLMMAVSLAASAAFMTPFSHKANLLVMGAGGYKSSDYLKVGSMLTVVLLALMVLLVPIFFPF